MTESERELLGPQSAEELAADERWLTDRLDSADRARPMPTELPARVMAAIRREVEVGRLQVRASRRRNWRVAVAAAALVLALVGGYITLMLSNRPATPAGDSVAAVQKTVDAYVSRVDASMRAVDRVNASLLAADRTADQVQREITQLNREVASAESAENPWTPVADVIMAGR